MIDFNLESPNSQNLQNSNFPKLDFNKVNKIWNQGKNKKNIIGFAPFSAHVSKQWPLKNYAERRKKEDKGQVICWSGGEKERAGACQGKGARGEKEQQQKIRMGFVYPPRPEGALANLGRFHFIKTELLVLPAQPGSSRVRN